MISHLMSRALETLGFRLERFWILQDDDEGAQSVREDDLPGEWNVVVPQLVNRHRKPARIKYRRPRFGDDNRVRYLLYFTDIRGQRVLELGPYEGHNIVILDKLGASEIVSVEIRPDNAQRCREVVEVFDIRSASIVEQDIEALYNGTEEPLFEPGFGFIYNVGVLYHVPNPLALLKWCRSQGGALLLGTHYAEPMSSRLYDRDARFGPWEAFALDGNSFSGRQYREGGFSDPLSGASSYSWWPKAEDVLRMASIAGYTRVHDLGREMHSGLPHMMVLCEE